MQHAATSRTAMEPCTLQTVDYIFMPQFVKDLDSDVDSFLVWVDAFGHTATPFFL